MVDPHPPTNRGLHRHLYQRRTWWGHMLILLPAILVLVAPLSAAGQAPQPASMSGPSASRISFQKLYVDGTGRGEILTASADGRGVRQLVPGMHNQDFCQSVDGRKIAYYSNQETPHQFLPYVADADGANAQKIHGEPVAVVCPFSERWLLLVKYLGGCSGPWALVRHDLQTGAEETVATNFDDRLSLSPDGNKLLVVGGLDYTPVPGRACPAGRETLNVLDLTTLDQRRVAGPLPRGKSYGVACFGRELLDARHCAGSWSPDGRRIAYTVGPSIYADIPTVGEPPVLSRAHQYAVYVQPVAGGAARRVLRFSGGPPSVSWSPDGGRLLVCANNRGRSSSPDATGCSGAGHAKIAGKLLLVGLARGSVRRVADGEKLVFAQWAPSGATYAYGTPAAVYVARSDGARRLLTAAPKPPSGGRWIGWSPDGRYIGLGSCRGRLAVLNVTTGQIRVLFRERKGEFKICAARWWR